MKSGVSYLPAAIVVLTRNVTGRQTHGAHLRSAIRPLVFVCHDFDTARRPTFLSGQYRDVPLIKRDCLHQIIFEFLEESCLVVA